VKWLTDGSAEIYVYGIDGKKLTTMGECYSNLTHCEGAQYNVYFKGKLVQAPGAIMVVTDRTGSVRWRFDSPEMMTWPSYYPYGEERTPTTVDDREKFATYMRDNPGQDYADQRYYGVGTGRFLSVDPGGMGNPASATTLNRYSYVAGDPVNNADPRGRDLMLIGGAGMGQTCILDGIQTDCSVVCNPTGGVGDAFLTDAFEDNPCDADPNPVPVTSGPTSAPTPDCLTGFATFMVNFVLAHYTDSVALGSQAGIPQDWILAWAADESGYGQSTIAKNGNYFGWHGSGNVRCPGITGCFNGTDPFLASGNTALFSTKQWFRYNGKVHVTAATILSDQYSNGATAAGAFSALQQAGYNGNVNYGSDIQGQYFLGNIDGIENCLRSKGQLQ